MKLMKEGPGSLQNFKAVKEKILKVFALCLGTAARSIEHNGKKS